MKQRIKITGAEAVTYIALYMLGVRTYARMLRRLYYFGIPFTAVLEWGITIGLLVFFIRTIMKYESYMVRMLYFIGISTLPYWLRVVS